MLQLRLFRASLPASPKCKYIAPVTSCFKQSQLAPTILRKLKQQSSKALPQLVLNYRIMTERACKVVLPLGG